jgi:hypothetical protein
MEVTNGYAKALEKMFLDAMKEVAIKRIEGKAISKDIVFAIADMSGYFKRYKKFNKEAEDYAKCLNEFTIREVDDYLKTLKRKEVK